MKQEEQEKRLREKAATYLVCFNDNCQLHEQCLRWKTGNFVPDTNYSVTCISPRYNKFLEGRCDKFRSAEIQSMHVGLKGFYHDMPGWMEQKVKNLLISQLGRTIYYKYHRGDIPIPPSLKSTIEELCRSVGWNQPLKYDTTEENFVW